MAQVVFLLDLLERLAAPVEVDYLPLELLGEAPRVLGVPHGLLLSRKVPHSTVQDIITTPFQELWRRINKKHAYTVSFDDEELIGKAVSAIDAKLEVSELAYTLTTGTQKETAKREDIEGRTHFRAKRTDTKVLEIDERIAVAYDLVGEVAQTAKVTRRTAATILSRINSLKFSLYKRNSEEFIKKASSIIVDEKATTIINHVTYHQIDEEFDADIFTERMPANISKALKAKKNIQDYVFFDSIVEKEFAEAMDLASEVCVYAKMPCTFKIPTPVGECAPD